MFLRMNRPYGIFLCINTVQASKCKKITDLFDRSQYDKRNTAHHRRYRFSSRSMTVGISDSRRISKRGTMSSERATPCRLIQTDGMPA